jgi:hypothetical protein
MFDLKFRNSELKGYVNLRTENHGEERVGAADFSLEGILLEHDEFNGLAGENTSDWVFVDRGGNWEVTYPQFKPFAFRDKYEGATVRLRAGLHRKSLELKDCNLSRITIEPLKGGVTELCLQVQVSWLTDEAVKFLRAYMGSEVEVEIEGGEVVVKDESQAELVFQGRDAPVTEMAQEAT